MRSVIRLRRGLLLAAMIALAVGVTTAALQPAAGTARPAGHSTGTP